MRREICEGNPIATQSGCRLGRCSMDEAVAAIEREEVEKYLKLRRERKIRSGLDRIWRTVTKILVKENNVG